MQPSRGGTAAADIWAPSRPQQLFGNLVDHCFMSCIDDFSSKAVSTRETGCVTRCVQKNMAMAQRLGERFQEHNAEMTAKANR